jgi:hypothetical protein
MPSGKTNDFSGIWGGTPDGIQAEAMEGIGTSKIAIALKTHFVWYFIIIKC